MLRRTGVKNKQNLMNDVKKKFHFEPTKNHTKGKVPLRHHNALHKGSSCTFSSVKPQNQDSNDGNESSWLSKLVNNINEGKNTEENIQQKSKENPKAEKIEKGKKDGAITRNTSLGSIFSMQRKNSNPLKQRKSSFQGLQKKQKNGRKMSVHSIIDHQESGSSNFKIAEEPPKNSYSFYKKELKKDKKNDDSIANYSTIKGEENDPIASLESREKNEKVKKQEKSKVVEEKRIHCQEKKQQIPPHSSVSQRNEKLKQNCGNNQRREKIGGIKKNKSKVESNGKLYTLEDYSVHTIKKEIESFADSSVKKINNEKEISMEKNKENERILNNIKYKYQEEKSSNYHPIPKPDRYQAKYNRRNQYKYSDSVDISFGDASKGNIKKNLKEETEIRKQLPERREKYQVVQNQRRQNRREKEKPLFNKEEKQQKQIYGNYFPLFPENSEKFSLSKAPYLEMPSIPVEQHCQQGINQGKNIEDLGFLLDNINKKLSIYIEQNHLLASEQKIELNFQQLRKNLY